MNPRIQYIQFVS